MLLFPPVIVTGATGHPSPAVPQQFHHRLLNPRHPQHRPKNLPEVSPPENLQIPTHKPAGTPEPRATLCHVALFRPLRLRTALNYYRMNGMLPLQRSGLFLLGLGLLALAMPADLPDQVTWNFDRLDRIGGHPLALHGQPRVIDTPQGKAILFDGVDDAIQLEVHPLAGAAAFTWEAIFRPDGGQAEQRWFHLEEAPATGLDSNNRMLFEIRVIDGKWCLDAFNKTGDASKALMDRTHLHPLGVWHHVAAVYDGKQFRSYVNGALDGSAEVQLAPQGPGRTVVGMRMNRVFHFKGAVRTARFTRRALAPAEFLKQPAP
jgi:hypothetical protein